MQAMGLWRSSSCALMEIDIALSTLIAEHGCWSVGALGSLVARLVPEDRPSS